MCIFIEPPPEKCLIWSNKAQDSPLSANLLFMRFSKLYQISGLWVKAFTRSVFGTHFPLNSDEAGRLTPFRTFQTATFCLQWYNKNTSGKKETDRERERGNSSKNRLRTRVERNDKECWEDKIHIRKGGFKCSQRPKWSIEASIVTAHMLQVFIFQSGTLISYSVVILPAHLLREALILTSCIKLHLRFQLCFFVLSYSKLCIR